MPGGVEHALGRHLNGCLSETKKKKNKKTAPLIFRLILSFIVSFRLTHEHRYDSSDYLLHDSKKLTSFEKIKQDTALELRFCIIANITSH